MVTISKAPKKAGHKMVGIIKNLLKIHICGYIYALKSLYRNKLKC